VKTVKAFIERGNDGTYSVYVDLENNTLNYGIHGDGDSAKEAVEDFISGYEEMKEFYRQKGKEFVEAKFTYVYDTASFLAYYSKVLSLAGLQRITGVNQGQLSHYVTGHRKPSPKTVEKIEKSLHAFAEEISQVHFV
jgi:hypothetical protein